MTATATVNVTARVTSVTLDKSTLMLKIGDNDVTLVPTINPVSATNKNVTWSSSNPSIATVDANGKVHVVAAGTVTITATSKQDSTKLAKCTVSVTVP